MSTSPTSSIIRSSLRKPEDKLNILTGLTHARYESNLAKTGHNFYAFQHDSFIKKWHSEYAHQPDNYICLDGNLKENQIPLHLDFDLVLSQNKFGQFQILSQIAQQLHLPLVSLEHTLPMPGWPQVRLEDCKSMRGNVNIFISEYSRDKWEWENNTDTHVIRHCVDAEFFKPKDCSKKNQILTVANDYINRDWCLNFKQYQNVTQDLPVFPVGDTPGLSNAASSQNELLEFYQQSAIFLNTAHISPIPTSLLEAMSCGCACVSCNASEIPYYITHGENGMLANNDEEMRKYLEILLNDKELCIQFGKAARETILELCSQERFIDEWDNVLRLAAEGIFRG